MSSTWQWDRARPFPSKRHTVWRIQAQKILHIIEVQNGPYLGEDDIVRFQDDYGRTKN